MNYIDLAFPAFMPVSLVIGELAPAERLIWILELEQIIAPHITYQKIWGAVAELVDRLNATALLTE